MVYLSNYIPYDTWSTESAQYQWLAADLAKVDRKVELLITCTHVVQTCMMMFGIMCCAEHMRAFVSAQH
jgi:hypothetical protein